MNAHYTYLLILGLSIAGPLALSFDQKVAFYKSYRAVAAALILPALLYIAWDAYFTAKGVWRFNEHYTTGIYLGNLPLEEVLFFLVVPYCCLFIYECIHCYFPRLENKRFPRVFLLVLGGTLIFTGLFFYKQRYTCWTLTGCGCFIFLLRVFKFFFKNFQAIYFLAAFLIVLVPFLLVNGFLTAIPVVEYNDVENLGVRIFTIPVEDVFYGMLLMMMNVACFEKFRDRRQVAVSS